MTVIEAFERVAPAFVESSTGRIAKYPRARWRRWMLRLIAALPYIALAVWFDIASHQTWAGTANAELAERVGGIAWNGSGIGVLASLYPPISSIVALVVPGGALGLGIVGALIAGFMLQMVIQALQRKDFHPVARIVFALSLALTPTFAYLVTTNLQAALGLLFFGLGMIDVVRFVTYANTQAGFRAGILFACSAFSDTTGLPAAVVAAVAGALIIQSRRGARLANAVVLVFPTLALLGALALLGVAFGAGPFAMVHGNLTWDPVRAATYVDSLGGLRGLVYLSSTLIVVLTAVLLRHARVGLVAVLLTAMIGLAFIVGLTPPGFAGNNYVMMLLLAVAIVPTPKSRVQAVLTVCVSLALWTIGWINAFQQPAISHWIHVLTNGGAS
ncbi:hypothetical protein [Microbacterium candidum]|uniref:DUF2029 domain-containing protein n=1 Tax=Microbacterium candidum TaxID=3041922 RepID=A0ABT7MZY6_9MICO|nr:hypothetical protein [Microbacterium sp. ASV49]MDL9979997.1 hypothetical protein [Microbacterium sp. ASV49]